MVVTNVGKINPKRHLKEVISYYSIQLTYKER